jgi:hypothetical protein
MIGAPKFQNDIIRVVCDERWNGKAELGEYITMTELRGSWKFAGLHVSRVLKDVDYKDKQFLKLQLDSLVCRGPKSRAIIRVLYEEGGIADQLTRLMAAADPRDEDDMLPWEADISQYFVDEDLSKHK